MSVFASCPEGNSLRDFALGQASPEQASSITKHILDCETCVQALNELRAGDTLREVLSALATLPDVPSAKMLSLIERLKNAQPSGDSQETAYAGGPVSDRASAAFGVDLAALLSPPRAFGELGWLDTYRVLHVLGKGAMGVVLECEDTQLERLVAVKVMLPQHAAHEEARIRFLREAKAVAALQHDNIVNIYQVGSHNGIPYFSMQLLQGSSLSQMIHQGRKLRLPQVLRIGRQIAQGLAAAHDKGLIHRDIKPSNLWIEPDNGGRVKIVDFGLARAQPGSAKARGEVQLTQTGMIVGTPSYMAPEQARSSKPVDHRCDLFSLGCVLYQLCTDDLPFKGDDTTGILLALVMDDPEPPARINADLPAEFSDLVMKLLHKDPAERVQTAHDVVSEIRKIERSLK